MYSAGTTLKIDYRTFFHYGIADGNGGVIHNSKKLGMVTLESEAQFSEGNEIIVCQEITSANPTSAAIHAKRYLGMPYHLIKSNCEHFARLCHGLEVESTQLQQYLLVALGAGIAAKSDNSMMKIVGGSVALASLLTPAEESPFKNASIAALIGVGVSLLAGS